MQIINEFVRSVVSRIVDLTRQRGNLSQRWGMPSFAATYNEDGLYTNHHCDFLQDPRFQAAYAALAEAHGGWHWPRRWRVHTLLWSAQVAQQIAGDMVECGTYRGGAAASVLSFTETRKPFWLCDAFDPSPEYLERVPSHTRSDIYEDVRQLFVHHANVHLVRGSLPESLDTVKADQISWLHIDCGLPEPEVESLHRLWPRVSQGGLIVLNSWSYPSFEDCSIGLHEWAKNEAVSVLTLPTGQGLIVRTGAS